MLAGDVAGDASAVEVEGRMTSATIQRLPVDVVNRIAAGEIIHRPANALKEMMENSLDAGATMIRVQLKEGGLKMLQIQDDGCGVSLADMPLLCERFATSKLRSFGDLSRMTTFGFRGEALASISYVTASMTVISRTRNSEMAYKASYASGKLVSPKPGQDASPRACAGSQGTFITAEDLFYNVPQRRRALRSANDEYNLALDVISKYAVHYGARGIGFSCKKTNSTSVDLSIPSASQMSTQDVVSLIYGTRVAKDLIGLPPKRDESLGAMIEGWISGPNWTQSRKAFFLLFINNRLVDSPALRRAVSAIYTTILPKGAHPWLYLSLRIDEENIDVNVHPTKREVHFLHEERIVEMICEHVEQSLTKVDVGRTFDTTQTLLRPLSNVGEASAPTPTSHKVATGYPQHTIRVDTKARTLDAMAAFAKPESKACIDEGDIGGYKITDSRLNEIEMESLQTQAWMPESVTDLESVFELRQSILSASSVDATEIARSHSLVGVVDSTEQILLLQHATKLYAVRYARVMEDVAYQMLLRRFGDFGQTVLEPAPMLSDLIDITLENVESDELNAVHVKLKKRICDVLVAHRQMLLEYFSIEIDCQGSSTDARLIALPDLTEQMPRIRVGGMMQYARIPALVVRLATQIDYTSEKDCLHGVLRELALLHVPLPSLDANDLDDRASIKQDWLQLWQPAMRHFQADRSLLKNNQIRSLASLPSLYNIFERC